MAAIAAQPGRAAVCRQMEGGSVETATRLTTLPCQTGLTAFHFFPAFWLRKSAPAESVASISFPLTTVVLAGSLLGRAIPVVPVMMPAGCARKDGLCRKRWGFQGCNSRLIFGTSSDWTCAVSAVTAIDFFRYRTERQS